MRGLMLAVCALTGMALAGCGHTQSRAGEPAMIAHRWLLAITNRDVKEACSLLDPGAQSMIKRELAGFVAAGATRSSCAALIAFVHDDVLSPQARKELSASTVREASVAGNAAIVRVGGNGNSGIIRLTMTNGRWQISEVPLAISK